MSNNNIKIIDEQIAVNVSDGSQNVVIIDPNKVYDSNSRMLMDRFVKQENFVLYANLRIIRKPSSTIVYNVNDNNSTLFSENELEINMLNPIKEIGGDKTIKYKNNFTVDYTDYFTSSNLNNTNGANINSNGIINFFDPETFGITNISISQNASFKPMVTIEFTDVQGKTLFESGNHPNNPYNIFYSFPYPTFILSIKGFYGKTIDYPLVLTKTNTKFDPESGSYKITAEFLSRTFSIYNSFLLIYAYIAPFMFPTKSQSYLGYEILKQIYDQQNEYYIKKYRGDINSLKRYVFNDGIYPKLIDLQTIKDRLSNTIDDQETTTNKSLISELDAVTINVKDRYDYILTNIVSPDRDDDLLNSSLEQINTTIRNISVSDIADRITKILKSNTRFYSESDKGLRPTILDRNNLNDFKRIIVEILEAIDVFRTLVNEKILNKQLINLSDQIGYMPNVYNVSRIIFNNIQAFLILMNIANKKALHQIQTNKDDLGNERKTFHDLFGEYTKIDSGGKQYQPFPNYYIKDDKQNVRDVTYKKTYPGYHVENKGWSEVEFIDEIYDSINRIKTILTQTKEDNITTKETFVLSNFNIKSNNLDAFNKTNGSISVLTTMIERFQLYNTYSGNVFRSMNADDLNNVIKSIVNSEYDYFSHLLLNNLDNSKQISFLNDLMTLLNGQRPYETIINTYTKNLKSTELLTLKNEITNDIIKTKGKNINQILKKYKLNTSIIFTLTTTNSQLFDTVSNTKITPIFLFDDGRPLQEYYLTETVPSYFSDGSEKLKRLMISLNKNNNTFIFGNRSNDIIIDGATKQSPIVVNPFRYNEVINDYGTEHKTLSLTINDNETLKTLLGYNPTASTITTNNTVKNNY